MPIVKSNSFIRNIFRLRFALAGFVGFWSLALFLTGCFTVLQHPRVEREDYLPDEITHTDRCTACHANMAAYWYTNPYKLVAPYSNPHLADWDYYYNYPWWLRDRFLEGGYASADSAAEVVPVNLRRFGRRGGVGVYAPPVSREPGSNTGLGISSTPSGGSSGGREQAPATPVVKRRVGLDKPTPKTNTARTRKKKDN